MSSRRVRFTATARAHIQRERDWWLGNRLRLPLFAQEIEDAIRVVASLPGAGTPYPAPAIPGLRRLYLRKLGCHLYFTYDEREVIVRALWAARRRRGPQVRA